jgi:hypothetical protein
MTGERRKPRRLGRLSRDRNGVACCGCDGLGIQDAPAAFGQEEQINERCKDTVFSLSKILTFVQRPDDNPKNGEAASKPQVKYGYTSNWLRPTGEQERLLRRWAGMSRFVWNRALSIEQACYGVRRNHLAPYT